MELISISFSERFKIGPLLGFSYYPPDEHDDYSELNIFLIFFLIRIAWTNEEEI